MRTLLYCSALVIILNGCQNDSQETTDTSTQYNGYLWHLYHTDNDFTTQYMINTQADINITQAWQSTKGSSIKVAVIDEGFEANHEDIKDNVYNGLTI
jgi:subtilisin family serine protease